jgi:hypothetical protein
VLECLSGWCRGIFMVQRYIYGAEVYFWCRGIFLVQKYIYGVEENLWCRQEAPVLVTFGRQLSIAFFIL